MLEYYEDDGGRVYKFDDDSGEVIRKSETFPEGMEIPNTDEVFSKTVAYGKKITEEEYQDGPKSYNNLP